jgi:hypothetical protein
MVVHRSRLIAAVCGLLALACQRERPGLAPQHVLLVTVENLRADHCSFLMHDRPTTWVQSDALMREEERAFGPDDLAARGVVFARCFAPSPVRDVSLATLACSRPPLESGVTSAGDRLPGEVVTLAEAFRAGGFATAAFLGGADPPDDSFTRGFSTVRSGLTDLEALRAAAQWSARDPGDGERTFVWVHLRRLAEPWDSRETSAEADAILDGRVFVDPAYAGPIDGSADVVRDVNSGALAPSAADRAALEAAYDAQVAYLSAELWTGLHDAYDFHTAAGEASETWPRTVFVLAGLNGIELLEHGSIGATGVLSDAALHVPLVVRHPDSLTGERIFDDVVGLEDVAPTLLEWFGLPALPEARGRSLLAVTDSYVEREFPERPAFAQLPDRGVFTARDGRWRVVWNPLGTTIAGRPAVRPPVTPLALYDLVADPAGLHDVSTDHPDVAERLVSAIRAWREGMTVFPAELKPPRRVAR